MNINKNRIDDLNLSVSVEINKDDYESKVNEVLRDYRRKANIPGFRPGKVPESMVRKMYGKAVLIDEINKLVSESLQNYLKEEQIQLLGEPMPKTTSDDLEWEIGNNFTFEFEMGLAPTIDLNLSKEDKITKYQITVDKELVDKTVDSYAGRYGKMVDTEAVVDFKEKLTGDIVQLDADNQPVENGLSAEDSSVLVSLIKDEEHRKPFEGAKPGDEVVFRLAETFPNDWEITSILKKKDKEEVGDISDSLFRFTVKKIEKFVNAEMNQELFDKVFGEGEVKSIEEFEDRIKNDIAADFEDAAFGKFVRDAREFLLDNINPPLPEEFLSKWLRASNKEIDDETFDKEFPYFLKTMKWDLIIQTIAKQKDLKVEEQDIVEYAKNAAKRQFAQYGMGNLPDDILTKYAINSLKEEKSIRDAASRVLEMKVVEVVGEDMDIVVQEMSTDDFNKMIYAANNKEAVNEE